MSTSRGSNYPAHASAIAFPLGGVGTGTVSLGARGEFRDWEIFNAPAKGQSLPNTFWALRAQAGDQPPTTRVLEAQLTGPHSNSHGYHASMTAGLPRFRNASLRGEYPLVRIEFDDPDVPVQVQLEAFTPLVPLNPEASGIPCAVFTFTVTNPGAEALAVSIAGSLINPVGGITYGEFGNPVAAGAGQNINEIRHAGQLCGVHLRSSVLERSAIEYGDLTLATAHPDVTFKPTWLRGRWHDYLRDFWRDFTTDGRLEDLGYEEPSADGLTDTGSLAAAIEVGAGETREVRFYLTWFFPNRRASWHNRTTAPMTQNFYATRFESSWDVAQYLADEVEWLERDTRLFHRALFSSTLPRSMLDAVSANIVPVRSNTCFWLEDGGFYGYEGCFDDHGSCAGTCTHVWSYAHTVAYLFPGLERRARLTEFRDELHPDGYLPFRSLRVFDEEHLWQTLEIGKRHRDERIPAAADGQLGSIIRVFREWVIGGDVAWLREVWPGVKQAMRYAKSEWDPDGFGILRGRQHTTFDIEFVGPNPLCTIYYLAALRAVAELATTMGETEFASSCADLASRGHDQVQQLLWNGSYYEQSAEELGDYPYQHGAGCLSDQLLGQLHARVLGLGHVLPASNVQTALRSVFDNNFRETLSLHHNTQRTFALNDEAGLLQCTWPNSDPPAYPFIYSDEVWTGTEYAVAAHMLFEGLVVGATTIVDAVRARQDGFRRNPWDEVESGHHYARAMSSWCLLIAAAGFQCDMGRGTLSFDPIIEMAERGVFSCPWFCGRGWGVYTQSLDTRTGDWTPSITVLGGDMAGVKATACGRSWTL